MINLELIKTLNPRQDMLNNYIKHYADRSFTKRQFMGLKHITHDDKVWVAFRLMTDEQSELALMDIAESVLPIPQNKHSTDKRPKQAAVAAVAAVVAITAIAAYAVAAVAAVYADAVVYVAVYAAAVACAATAVAYAIAYAVAYAAKDKPKQKKLIRTIILKHWR